MFLVWVLGSGAISAAASVSEWDSAQAPVARTAARNRVEEPNPKDFAHGMAQRYLGRAATAGLA